MARPCAERRAAVRPELWKFPLARKSALCVKCAMTTPLQAFLDEKGLTLAAFAAQLGRPVSTVHGWACGRRKPQWSDIPAIERATGGAVTARDFVPQEAA